MKYKNTTSLTNYKIQRSSLTSHAVLLRILLHKILRRIDQHRHSGGSQFQWPFIIEKPSGGGNFHPLFYGRKRGMSDGRISCLESVKGSL